MNELACQSLIVKAVKQHDGIAFKMANRFLAGIPDLFIHLPALPTSLWEVKLGPSSKLTALQQKFLMEFKCRGGVCGIITVYQGSAGLSINVSDFENRDLAIHPLPRGHREATIVRILRDQIHAIQRQRTY